MRRAKSVGYGWLAALFVSGQASAWFFFFPGSLIQKALETDPESISVSSTDRALGKCAGLHVNQNKKWSTGESAFPDDKTASPESPRAIFHRDMADAAIGKASDKEKVADLARAYSTRWGRVASADQSANRSYGIELAKACVTSGIPVDASTYARRQAQEAEKKRLEVDAANKRAEEEQIRLRSEQEARRAVDATERTATSATTMDSNSLPLNNIDYPAEARKSARILGCSTQDVRVLGADGQNVLFSATCDGGQALVLACDPSGLCLKR